jgi:hypothetical protein
MGNQHFVLTLIYALRTGLTASWTSATKSIKENDLVQTHSRGKRVGQLEVVGMQTLVYEMKNQSSFHHTDLYDVFPWMTLRHHFLERWSHWHCHQDKMFCEQLSKYLSSLAWPQQEGERIILLNFDNNGTITCLPSFPHVLCNLGISTQKGSYNKDLRETMN